MTPQTQLYLGRGGESGDCHRTCIAMVLNMGRDAVPHFMAGLAKDLPADDPLYNAALDAEVEWLTRRGLTVVNIPFPGETPLAELLHMLSAMCHGAPVVLGCSTPNGNHSVVVHEGRIHNPNPYSVIVGPMMDGIWWLSIYSVGPGWRTPRWIDKVRAFWRQFACNPFANGLG